MAGDGKPAHRVVIVGGGFGGLLAAQGLQESPGRGHPHRPPQLPPVPAAPLPGRHRRAVAREHRRPRCESILRKQRNAKVVLGEVVGFDVAAKTVQLKDGAAVPFDTLILATGATHHYFGNDAWADFAPGLKTIEDATEIRRRILSAFEKAERETGPGGAGRGCSRSSWSGAGRPAWRWPGRSASWPTKTMRFDFRNFDPASCRVVLVEGQTRVLSMFHEKLSAKALTMLTKLGVAGGPGRARHQRGGRRGGREDGTTPRTVPTRIETENDHLGGGGEGVRPGEADRGPRSAGWRSIGPGG